MKIHIKECLMDFQHLKRWIQSFNDLVKSRCKNDEIQKRDSKWFGNNTNKKFEDF